jgi:hypothetical protein
MAGTHWSSRPCMSTGLEPGDRASHPTTSVASRPDDLLGCNDVHAAYRRLLSLGGRPHQEPREHGAGFVTAHWASEPEIWLVVPHRGGPVAGLEYETAIEQDDPGVPDVAGVRDVAPSSVRSDESARAAVAAVLAARGDPSGTTSAPPL